MRQVPYLIIGNGRVASHFRHYLTLSGLSYYQWHRSSAESLATLVEASQTILLLISDNALGSFVAAHESLFKNKQLVHFSGAHYYPNILGLHPLMSFAKDWYDLKLYQVIPFFIDRENIRLTDIFPGLVNPYFYVAPQQKAYYHALCVIANNFTTILWEKFFREMHARFAVPKEALLCYLTKTYENIVCNEKLALTGPLARKDTVTIQKNLQALEEDPFYPIYKAFVELTQEEKVC